MIPTGQRDPAALDRALADTPYAATGDLARWLYGETGSCFLDATWEMQVLDNDDWTPGFIADLTAQWREAEALMARVDALATLLEADPDAHFAALLRAIGAIPRPGATGDVGGDAVDRTPGEPVGPGNETAITPDDAPGGGGDDAEYPA